jgi:hypothetical protein
LAIFAKLFAVAWADRHQHADLARRRPVGFEIAAVAWAAATKSSTTGEVRDAATARHTWSGATSETGT